MKKASQPYLAPREQQIMAIVYAADGGVTAADLVAALPDPLSNSAVRTFLKILEAKGHLRHEKRGREFVYHPTQPRQSEARSALDRVVTTFFRGSVEQVVATLLDARQDALTDDELARLEGLIAAARERGQ